MERTTLAALTGEPHAEVFDGDPRTVRLSLDAGDAVPAHSHPGTRIVFHLLEGRLELTLDGETHELSAGDLARFGGDREIAPRALEPATAVIVLAPAG